MPGAAPLVLIVFILGPPEIVETSHKENILCLEGFPCIFDIIFDLLWFIPASVFSVDILGCFQNGCESMIDLMLDEWLEGI